MKKLQFVARASVAFVVLAGAANAGDTGIAWGTVGGTMPLSTSASLHNQEGNNAQIATIGRDITSIYRSVTSCGSCVYYNITGNGNEIEDNYASGINSGDINATGTFYH